MVDTCLASLPIDLIILEIFLRLDPAAVICCAGVCKPWRRAIIANASILGRRLDQLFGPSLVLGVFHSRYEQKTRLRRTPGPFQSALPVKGRRCGGSEIPANSLMPDAGAASAAFQSLLSARDGFVLLATTSRDRLCLCNPVTGYCTIIFTPAATAAGKNNQYILLTGDDAAVCILALHVHGKEKETLAYQLLSTSSGDTAACMWGPVVQSSGDDPLGFVRPIDTRNTVVDRNNTVYWHGHGHGVGRMVVALDVHTGRTWTTELPVERGPSRGYSGDILAVLGDGRLSMIRSLWGPIIQVWVLLSSDDNDDDRHWTLQQTMPIDVHSQLVSQCPPGSDCHRSGNISRAINLTAFCPRSRCVVAVWADQELLIDVESGGCSLPRIRRIGFQKGYGDWPYEMDSSSTYMSKMKHY